MAMPLPDVAATANRIPGRITQVDAHTVRTDAVGLTYPPVRAGSDGNYARLLTLELPAPRCARACGG